MLRVPPLAKPAAVIAGLLFTVIPAGAQGTAQERSACMGDAFRFCAGDIPDVAKIEACLESRQSELTPACRAEFKPAQAKKTRLTRGHFR